MLSARARANPPSIGFSVAALVILAAATWRIGAIDMDRDFLPWFAHLRAAGPIGAFATPFSSYAPLCLYPLALGSLLGGVLAAWDVLKLVFFGGHVLLVFALAHLLKTAGADRPYAWAFLAGLAPSLFANPAIIGQCDAYWAAALVMAVAAALQHRHARMFAWCGIAVAIKLQAGFLGPVFLTLALSRRVPFRLWLIAPLVYAATMVPAALAGWPVKDLALIYFRQVGWSESIALNAPNIWMLASTAGIAVPTVIATVMAVSATGAFVWHFTPRLRCLDSIDIVRVACLCALIVPGLLPRMHERYFFMADVLTLALVALKPTEWRAALCTQIGSTLGILAYFTDQPIFACVGAVAMMTATWLIARGCLPTRSVHVDTTRHMATA